MAALHLCRRHSSSELLRVCAATVRAAIVAFTSLAALLAREHKGSRVCNHVHLRPRCVTIRAG